MLILYEQSSKHICLKTLYPQSKESISGRNIFFIKELIRRNVSISSRVSDPDPHGSECFCPVRIRAMQTISFPLFRLHEPGLGSQDILSETEKKYA